MKKYLLCIALLLFCFPVNVKAACNHEWSDWYVYDEVSCTEKEREKRLCYECDKEEYRYTKDKLGHVWSDWVITEQPTCAYFGTKERTCARCKEWEECEVPRSSEHKFNEWEVETEPDVLSEGLEVRTCDCKAKNETRSIAKLKPTIKLNKKKLTLKKGKTYKLKIKKMTYGDYYKYCKSSKSKIAKVSDYNYIDCFIIKAKKKGTCKITVKLASGIKATCTVKVK